VDKYHVKTKRVILIAYFSDVIWITELFGSLFDLRGSTIKAMRKVARKKFAKTYGIDWEWDDVSPLQTVNSFNGPLLLIHHDKDHEVPIEQAIPLQKQAPHAQIMTTSGFGHRKILMNKKVVGKVVDFIND
jgi:pimeloyl-ACP methyl ester carboxylesterase